MSGPPWSWLSSAPWASCLACLAAHRWVGLPAQWHPPAVWQPKPRVPDARLPKTGLPTCCSMGGVWKGHWVGAFCPQGDSRPTGNHRAAVGEQYVTSKTNAGTVALPQIGAHHGKHFLKYSHSTDGTAVHTARRMIRVREVQYHCCSHGSLYWETLTDSVSMCCAHTVRDVHPATDRQLCSHILPAHHRTL